MQLHTMTSDTTDPAVRGTLLGTRYADQLTRVVGRYLDHFSALGLDPDRVRVIAERCHEALRRWHRPLAVESDACADAAGLARWTLAGVGARTEVIAAAPARRAPARSTYTLECSTAVLAPPDGAPETLQTWDWYAALVPDALLHALTPAPGRVVKVFTEFGSPGKIGVNSAGLGLHLNMLSHATDGDPTGGVPVHAIARRILDEADTLEQATSLAGSAPVGASTALTVVTGRGEAPARAVSLELCPAGMAVIEPGGDSWLLHTNHFLDPRLSTDDTVRADSTTTERLSHLRRVRAEMAGLSAAARARAFCGADGADSVVCAAPNPRRPVHERSETLLTIGLDTGAGSLDYLVGGPAIGGQFQRF